MGRENVKKHLKFVSVGGGGLKLGGEIPPPLKALKENTVSKSLRTVVPRTLAMCPRRHPCMSRKVVCCFGYCRAKTALPHLHPSVCPLQYPYLSPRPFLPGHPAHWPPLATCPSFTPTQLGEPEEGVAWKWTVLFTVLLFVCTHRHHKGHTCDRQYCVVSIVLWEGLSSQRSSLVYRQLTDLLPKYGNPTQRRCESNERSVV